MRASLVKPILALLAALLSTELAMAQAADPTQLNPASRQIPNWDAYSALNLPAKPSNYRYPDPVTGVYVTKVTSAAAPQVNFPPENNGSVFVDYSEGGPFISSELSTGQHTILVRPAGGYPPRLVNYQRGTGVVTTSWRQFPTTHPLFPGGPPYPRLSLSSSFSNVASTAHILFFVEKDTLYRFNTQTMTFEGDGGHIGATGRKFTQQDLGTTIHDSFWMQSSQDDKWFVFLGCTVNPNDLEGACVVRRVIAYNRETDVVLWRGCDAPNKIFNCYNTDGDPWDDRSDLDEPHLDRNGDYVALLDGTMLPGMPPGQEDPDCARGGPNRVFDGRYWHLWNLNTNTHVCKGNIYAPHTGWVRGYFPNHDGDETASRNFYYSAATDMVTWGTPYDDPKAFHASHRAGQWIQPVADTTQWYWGSNYSDGEVRAGAWAPLTAPRYQGDTDYTKVYVSVQGDCDERRDPLDPLQYVETGVICWTPDYLKRNIGIRAVYQSGAGIPVADPNRLLYSLAQVNSIAAITHGTFYYDAASQLLYVWAIGTVAPKDANNHSRIFMFAPTPVHRGVGVRRLNGTDVRILCHNYSWSGLYDPDTDAWYDDYSDTPFASTSPDGKLVMFNSNMGKRDGRVDVFIAEVPLTGGGGGGCGSGSGTSGPPIEC